MQNGAAERAENDQLAAACPAQRGQQKKIEGLEADQEKRHDAVHKALEKLPKGPK